MLNCKLLKGASCVQLKAFFPRDGSTETPPHPSADFNWKDYCPTAFGKLREVFNIEAAEYMKSICGRLISQLCLCPCSSYSCAHLLYRTRSCPCYVSAHATWGPYFVIAEAHAHSIVMLVLVLMACFSAALLMPISRAGTRHCCAMQNARERWMPFDNLH